MLFRSADDLRHDETQAVIATACVSWLVSTDHIVASQSGQLCARGDSQRKIGLILAKRGAKNAQTILYLARGY